MSVGGKGCEKCDGRGSVPFDAERSLHQIPCPHCQEDPPPVAPSSFDELAALQKRHYEERNHYREKYFELMARVAMLEDGLKDALDAINRDKTGLARTLDEIITRVNGSVWITEGRGPYEWDDDRYRLETGVMIEAVRKLALGGIAASGRLADVEYRRAEAALRGRKLT